jgi:hypothetical protein
LFTDALITYAPGRISPRVTGSTRCVKDNRPVNNVVTRRPVKSNRQIFTFSCKTDCEKSSWSNGVFPPLFTTVIIIPPKYAVSKIVGELKANSSLSIRNRFPWIKQVYVYRIVNYLLCAVDSLFFKGSGFCIYFSFSIVRAVSAGRSRPAYHHFTGSAGGSDDLYRNHTSHPFKHGGTQRRVYRLGNRNSLLCQYVRRPRGRERNRFLHHPAAGRLSGIFYFPTTIFPAPPSRPSIANLQI